MLKNNNKKTTYEFVDCRCVNFSFFLNWKPKKKRKRKITIVFFQYYQFIINMSTFCHNVNYNLPNFKWAFRGVKQKTWTLRGIFFIFFLSCFLFFIRISFFFHLSRVHLTLFWIIKFLINFSASHWADVRAGRKNKFKTKLVILNLSILWALFYSFIFLALWIQFGNGTHSHA